MTDLIEHEARTKAEALLVEMYADEFDAIYQELCVVRGLEQVTVYRTVYKRVAPIDAITLVRHGWKVLDEDSL